MIIKFTVISLQLLSCHNLTSYCTARQGHTVTPPDPPVSPKPLLTKLVQLLERPYIYTRKNAPASVFPYGREKLIYRPSHFSSRFN
jgi:hypothetical protein